MLLTLLLMLCTFTTLCMNQETQNLIKHGIAETQGRRPSMEDAHHVEITSKYAFFGLYDGHGGREVADFAANKLYTYCNFTGHESVDDVVRALGKGFLKTHASLGDPSEHERRIVKIESRRLSVGYSINADKQGCTAMVAFIRKSQLFVANAGDSRAILCRAGHAMPLSVDHKPSRPDEKERIENVGGTFTNIQGHLYICKSRYGKSIGVSRALGDKYFHPCVIPHPEIYYKTLKPDDEFLILACDGVWDVLNNQSAVNIVKESLTNNPENFKQAAQKLMHEAYKKGSTDNISVIVVGLESFIDKSQ